MSYLKLAEKPADDFSLGNPLTCFNIVEVPLLTPNIHFAGLATRTTKNTRQLPTFIDDYEVNTNAIRSPVPTLTHGFKQPWR